MIFVAPTEPPELRAIADVVSMKSEDYGADVLFLAHSRRIGVQRKTWADLQASLSDGRLSKQVIQMASLDYAIIIIEGEVRWTEDGKLWQGTYGQEFTKDQWRGLSWSLKDRGIWVEESKDLADTIELVLKLKGWMEKTRHDSLLRRPGLGRGVLGTEPLPEEYMSWLIQGLPGIGVELARRIVEMYGLCIGLKIGVDELLKVKGMGKVKAEKIVKVLGMM